MKSQANATFSKVIPNPIFYFIVQTVFDEDFVCNSSLSLSVASQILSDSDCGSSRDHQNLGKPHVRIFSVQPEFCRKGGGG